MNAENAVASDVIRVLDNHDGTFDIVDFSKPPKYHRAKAKRVTLMALPEIIRNALVILQITKPGERVDGVGYRSTPDIYWINVEE